MGPRQIFLLAVLLSCGAGLLYAQDGDLEAYMARGRELSKAGKIDQALPYFMLALEIAETRIGAEDPAVIPVVENLADTHAAMGNYRDAEPLYQRALKVQEREAARYQAGIARTLNSLGNIYEATDRSQQALEMYRQVLTTWAPVLGATHPEVKTASDRFAKLALQGPAPPAKTPPAPAEAPPVVAAPKVAVPEIAEAPREPQPAPPPESQPTPKQEPRRAQAPPEPQSARAPPGAGFAIHVTSIRDPKDAAAEWSRLRRIYGPLLADLDLQVSRVDLGPARGIYYRIRGGTLTRDAARARCAAFTARKVWCDVTASGAEAERPRVAARDEAAAPPPPAPAEPGAAPAAYRIHLTSIRDPKDAGAEWRRLQRIYGSLLDGLSLVVARVDLGAPKGIYYRIEGGLLSRDAARALCAQFAARDVWCRVVRPGQDTATGPQRLALRQVRRWQPPRRRGTRRVRDSVYLRIHFRDRGCRRSPFAPYASPLGSRRWMR